MKNIVPTQSLEFHPGAALPRKCYKSSVRTVLKLHSCKVAKNIAHSLIICAYISVFALSTDSKFSHVL